MPSQAKEYLLAIFNKFYKEAYFPDHCRPALVIPIPKPEKSRSIPTNYKPIALTSCLSKVFEGMINKRLLEYVKMRNVFAGVQCGFRKNKSTMNHLVWLESEVRKAFALGEQVVSVFFGLEKAYDMT